MTGTKKRKTICSLLIGLNLAFIWGNSLVNGADSGAFSGGIMAWINGFLGLGAAGAEILHLLIRKAAHFTEFASLGMLLAWGCCMKNCSGGTRLTGPLLAGVLAACIDETIQIFVDGRGSSLLDVWVDIFGVLTGIVILLLGHHYRKKKHNYNILEETT